MTGTGNQVGEWLRPALTANEHADQLACGGIFERGGRVVRHGRTLSQLVHRRPPGITSHQWNSAMRTHFDFVVCDAHSYLPEFAVEFADREGGAEAERDLRMTRAVCEAIGLPLLRVGSSVVRAGSYGRRIVEYVIDARTFMAAGSEHEVELPADEPLSYRNIVGRLPDGRSGFVNDLGATARTAAVEAYANRRLADPLIRGLHVHWQDGSAEGWGWVEVRDGWYLFERTRIWSHQLSCGVDPGQFAEDLAIAGIGERLKMLDAAEPKLHGREHLGREFDQLRLRRGELEGGFAYDHISFG